MMPVEIDGNDGTGKTLLVAQLRALGIDAADRGAMTRAADEDAVGPSPGCAYLLLDAPVDVSRQRLAAAGKDLSEQYHTISDLAHYRERFVAVAQRFGAVIIDATMHPRAVLQAALAALLSPLRVGIPKGRLSASVAAALAPAFPLTQRGRSLNLGAPGMRPLLLKPRAVAFMVASGLLDVAFCGMDSVWESGLTEEGRIAVLATIPTGTAARVCAASDRADLLDCPPARPLIVATEFPQLTDRWLTAMNLAHVSVQTHGSTEGFVPEFADMIVDIVETGQTLRDNGLLCLRDFGAADLVLIGRPDAKDRADVRALIDTMKGQQ